MRYVGKNIHILIFAVFWLSAALWVASSPRSAALLVDRIVQDAAQLREFTQDTFNKASRLSDPAAVDEALAIYVATFRMPSVQFTALAERIKKVEQKLAGRRGALVRP